jgi:hypothetical protein
MSAGMVYNLTPAVENEERYDVTTGIRRRGSIVLNVNNLTVGDYLPSFTPICVDLAHKTAEVVKNVKVVVDVSATDEVIKVAKGSLLVAGMFIGNGSKGATIVSVDKSNTDYDAITVDATLGVKIPAGTVLFEASAADGKTQKHIANSALYGRWKVTTGINNIAVLRTAAEIEPSKLDIPFSDNDKAAMKGWFEFNE